jgi:hypothetical protein
MDTAQATVAWAITGYLWKEKSLIVLNISLTIVYIIGLIYNT